jgi:hypothetical protein
MIVYVESNFILELAYLQEGHEACAKILEYANGNSVHLILPAYAVAEPYSAWAGRKKRRAQLHSELTKELKELGRSEPYSESREEFQDITRALLASGEEEKRRLDAAIELVLERATLIPLDDATVRRAIGLQVTSGLGPQDSLIYASVLSHLASVEMTEPKCFLTSNSKDFANPVIIAELSSHGCGLSTNFGEAYGMILKHLSAS